MAFDPFKEGLASEVKEDKGSFDPFSQGLATPAEAIVPRGTTPSDYEVFRENYIRQQQRPTLNKALEKVFAPVVGVKEIVSDISGLPAGLGEASGTENPIGTTLNSLLEGGRRTGAGFINLGNEALNQAIMGSIRNPGMPIAGVLANQVEGTLSRTPTEPEVENAFFQSNLQQNLNRPENILAPFTGGISEKLAQGTSQTLPLLIPAIGAEERALAAGLARRPVTSVANTIERTFQRGVTKAPLEDVVTSVTGVAPIDGGVQQAQTAVGRILEKTGKFPTREIDAAETLLKRADPTQKALLEDARSNLKKFDKGGGTINELDAVQQARNKVSSEFQLSTGDEGALNAIFDKPEFRNLKEATTSSNVQEHLREFNTQYHRQVDKKSPEALAYRTVRDFLSDKVDDVVKLESGKDISPYRDWGVVEDFKQGLQGRIGGSQRAQAGGPSTGGGIPFTQKGAIAKAVKAAGGRVLVPREIEGINQGTLRLIKDLPKPGAARALTPEELTVIQYRINPPPIIGEAPKPIAIPPPNTAQIVEAKIQERIGSYSPQFVSQNDAEVIRQLAIDQLKSEGLIPRR